MKEQDAAHSFDKRTNSDRYIPTKQTDPDKVAASLRGKLRDANRELTRLRLELQQERDKARNQAIQDCIDIVSVTPGDENVIPKLEQLKTKP